MQPLSEIMYFFKDVDECSDSDGLCGFNASCNNTLGGFRCDCDLGYHHSASSTSCEGKDKWRSEI